MNDSTQLVTLDTARKIAQKGVAEALTYVEIATGFTVETAEDAAIASEQLKGLNQFNKSYDAKRKEITDPYRQIGADIKAEFDVALNKGAEAENLLRSALAAYVKREEEKARVAREAAEKQARIEREEAAEKLAREQARAATLKTPEAQEKARDRIEAAEAEVENAAVAAVVVQAPAKVAGFSVRDNWQPEYGNINDLIKAAAADPKLAAYLTWNTKECSATVKALKARTDIPGIRAVNNTTTAVR